MSRRGRSGRPVSVGRLLPRALRRLDLDRVVEEQHLVSLWPSVVGEKIAAHTTALDLKRGVFRVAVDSQGWMTQLMFLKPQLLRKLVGRARKGAVKDIRFTLARGPHRA